MLSDSETGDAAHADGPSLATLSAVAASRDVYCWWQHGTAPTSRPAAALPRRPRRLDGAARVAQLRAAINRLPQQQQEIVRLRFLEGRSTDQIAARTGLSCDTIKAVQLRALALLAQLLGDDA